MTKIVDKNGAEISAPDLSKGTLTPLETVHYEAVAHKTAVALPGGMTITSTVVDEPARDEVTVYLYTPYPAPAPTADELAAGLAEVAEMSADNSAAIGDVMAGMAELASLLTEKGA